MAPFAEPGSMLALSTPSDALSFLRRHPEVSWGLHMRGQSPATINLAGGVLIAAPPRLLDDNEFVPASPPDALRHRHRKAHYKYQIFPSRGRIHLSRLE